jgi:hypothetical protein
MLSEIRKRQGISQDQENQQEETMSGRREQALLRPAKQEGRTTSRFNRYLYENLVSNVEVQIESWNRQASRQSNLEAAQALRLKAEGLGYTLRLLDAFQPEFRELIDCASHCTSNGSA